MKNNLSEYNAKIGSEFDKQAAKLKTKNLKYTYSYIGFLASGAVFADLGGIIDSKVSFSIAFVSTLLSLIIYRKKKRQNLTEQWTYTRVVAESIKSEWFKYIVGGGDYPCNKDVGEEYYKNLFEKNIQEKILEYRTNIINVNGLPIEFELEVESVLMNKLFDVRDLDGIIQKLNTTYQQELKDEVEAENFFLA